MPIQPRTAYPQEHIYTQLVFRGVTLPLDADQVLRGNWRVKDNRDQLDATLVNDQKKRLPILCAELFVSVFSTLVPPMLHPASPPKITSILDQEKLLEVEDNTVYYSSASSGENVNMIPNDTPKTGGSCHAREVYDGEDRRCHARPSSFAEGRHREHRAWRAQVRQAPALAENCGKQKKADLLKAIVGPIDSK